MVCISRGDLGHPAPHTRPCLGLEHHLLYHVTKPLWCHPAEDSGGWWHQLLYSITHFSYINAEDWLTFKISGKQLYRAKLCCSGKNNQPTPLPPKKNPTNLKKSGSLWRYCFSFFFCTWKTMTSNFPCTISTHSQLRGIYLGEDRSFLCLALVLCAFISAVLAELPWEVLLHLNTPQL